MKWRKSKQLLALSITAAMLAGSVNPTVMAAEFEETQAEVTPVWEVVEDEPIQVTELTEGLETEEVVETEAEFADDEQVRVFIVFEGDSVIDAGYSTTDISDNQGAVALAESIENQQEEVIDTIEEEALEGEKLETRYSFTMLTNAVSADVDFGQIADIEAIDGVSGVYVMPRYDIMEETADPQTITSGDMVGSYNTWASGYTGAGMRVAVIDTGLDEDHPSFDEAAYLFGLNETAEKEAVELASYNLLTAEEIAPKLELLNASKMYEGLTAEDLYRSAKVPFGFNYVDEGLDITHDNDTQGDHGTHVSGITTSNKYVPQEDGTFAPQENGVVGIAPDAQLFTMKVFGSNGGAYPDDYMAAIEDAIVLGADVINLSLGSSSAGNTVAAEDYINEIFDKLVGSDTVVSISAGNSSYWSEHSQYGLNLATDVNADTCGSPGSYRNSFTVASAVNSGYTGKAAKFDDEILAFYNDGSSAENAPFESLDTNGNGTEYEFVLIPAYGEEADFENVDVEGKVVLVSRGAISFYVKHNNAEAAGAAACLVYNNQAGSIGMNLTGSTAKIPCASIYLADAQAIMEEATYDEEKNVYTGKVVVSSKCLTNYNAAGGYNMSDFSSWGTPDDLALKPEITAPGGNIYSTIDKGEYGNMSGTSMAAPSITGMAALVKQYIEENDLTSLTGLSSRTLSQSLLMSTASPLYEDLTGPIYSPRKQGAGLANVWDATHTPAYILVGDKENNDGKVKVEFGDDPERTGKYGFDFTIYNMSDEPVFFVPDAIVTTETVLEDEGLKYIANSSTYLNPTVSFDTDCELRLFDCNIDGRINKYDAKFLLAYLNGSVHSQLLTCTIDNYDFDGDGVVDTKDVQKFLKAVTKKENEIDLTRKVIYVLDEAKVSVDIQLTDEDKEYIDGNFENGMYVEGYVRLYGRMPLTIPMLGFYGNWTESSMFEPFDYMGSVHGQDVLPTYSGVAATNFITYKPAGTSKALYYKGNMYEKDDEYIADRNALNSESGDAIGSFAFSLIRNADKIAVTVTNAETNEEYFRAEKESTLAEFYSASSSSWVSTIQNVAMNWAGTDASGNPLPEGTKVNITVTALPSYYRDGKHTPAAGTQLTYPMTIDNTNPAAELGEFTEETATISVTDNEYVAAVYLVDSDKETVLSSYAVNQTEKATATDVTVEYPKTVFYVVVLDYAGNSTTYRVNMSGEEDTEIASGITLNHDTLDMLKGSAELLKARVMPVTILDDSVTWSSDNEEVVTVNEKGIVVAVGEGSATVTATTVALDENGEQLTATCEINVFTLDVDLNGIVWDEEGQVYFSSFNTKTLPEYQKVSEKQGPRFWSTAVVGDKLLASTHSDDESSSDYYFVDPTTFETTPLGTDTWSTDMAYGAGNDIVVGTYGNFVHVINSETGAMEGHYNLSKYVGSAAIVGVSYISSVYYSQYEKNCDWFYLVDENGELYQWGLLYGLGFFCYDLGSTGISTNGQYYYNSIYYDENSDFTYWAVYDDSDIVTLYAIKDVYDEETDSDVLSTYAIGAFPDKVWPVSGLYMDVVSDDEISEDLEAKISREGALDTTSMVKEVKPLGRKANVKKAVAPVVEAVSEAEEVVAPVEAEVEATEETVIEE